MQTFDAPTRELTLDVQGITPAVPMKHIIFDFDGTIADSFDVFIESIGVVLKYQQKMLPAEITHLRRLPLKEIIEKLGVKKWQIPRLVIQGRREINARIDRVEAFTDMPEVIRGLAVEHSIYILSTNSQDNILHFLDKYELRPCIKAIYADVGLLSKARSLKKLQIKEKIDSADCLYIGDETRDIEAAKEVGMRCVAVEWGFSNPMALAALEPSDLVGTPTELVKSIAAVAF